MSQNHLGSLPIYRKALELCTLSQELASFVSYNKNLLTLYQSDSHRDHIADSLITDAVLIPQQIARAETSPSMGDRMKSATFIGIMLRNISSYCNGLEKDGLREKEYLNLLRREIRLFRRSFKKWRKSLVSYNHPRETWHFREYLS
ncbi:hypothetical protein [Muriicola marianensis]|uniref:Four helix bundle protein n=1 Tax=Muriicola marianensis TaxID=1324801 RepID=A0ABQ1R380_9FLAO|nr:hypothetical protein [Muriicola marianensis]GGD56548.1 hypothetical protein GCM10011361_23870 [Muriicola marianensis]